jgi:NAD(P)-dependent dehydrogenase (short-subunit alcohol dehydrogenase family)
MMNVFNLAGKNVLVTGGGTGIGFAISAALVTAGARVLMVGRREDVLIDACKTLGENASYKVFDIAALEQIPAFAKAATDEFGEVDVLINNAGINMKKEFLDVTDADFESIMRINQQAAFALSREFARHMMARKSGCIIMISSMAAKYGIPKVISYTAAKSAIEGMTRAMAVDLSPSGIRVNCIAPGFIETAMSAKALNSDPERKARVMARTPMGFMGKPEDVGYAAVFLASDAAKYITGVVLPVDGGNSIGF